MGKVSSLSDSDINSESCTFNSELGRVATSDVDIGQPHFGHAGAKLETSLPHSGHFISAIVT